LRRRRRGTRFAGRVERLAIPRAAIHLVALAGGTWTLTPMRPDGAAPAAAPQAGLNTRRVPRFPILDPREAVVQGHTTNLVNISVLGVQVVSEPVLRPGANPLDVCGRGTCLQGERCSNRPATMDRARVKRARWLDTPEHHCRKSSESNRR